jgi:hypothetical protein
MPPFAAKNNQGMVRAENLLDHLWIQLPSVGRWKVTQLAFDGSPHGLEILEGIGACLPEDNLGKIPFRAS